MGGGWIWVEVGKEEEIGVFFATIMVMQRYFS